MIEACYWIWLVYCCSQ